jgi:hypothetical protein
MKIYIGTRQINDDSFKTVAEPQILNYLAEDSECTTIIIDNILKQSTIENAAMIIDLAVRKLRLGGSLLINDIDFDLLTFIYEKNPDIISLNQMVSNTGGFKMFLTMDLTKQLVSRYNSLSLISSKINGLEFTLEYKRES